MDRALRRTRKSTSSLNDEDYRGDPWRMRREVQKDIGKRRANLLCVRRCGLSGTAHRFQRLLAARDAQAHLVSDDAAQLNEMEPALDSRFQQSLYLPGEAPIDNRALLNALVISLEEAGVQCHSQILIEGDALPAAGVVVDCFDPASSRNM